MVGTINITDAVGPSGPSGANGVSGPSGPSGANGAQGTVSALATGTYTIGTLYVSSLTVTSVGAANISSANDLNLRAVGQVTVNAPFVLTTSTTAGLGSLSGITQRGAMVYVTDAVGGAQPCFFDGTNWRQVTDRTSIA
jgi:hypothetical protein